MAFNSPQNLIGKLVIVFKKLFLKVWHLILKNVYSKWHNNDLILQKLKVKNKYLILRRFQNVILI